MLKVFDGDDDDLVTEFRKTRETLERHGTSFDRRVDGLEQR